MKKVFVKLRKQLIYTNPLIFGIYPVLFLYATNISEYREKVIIIPLFLAILFSLVIFLLFTSITRRLPLAAIISSYTIIAFFSYSRLKQVIKFDGILLLVFIVLLVLICFLIKKYQSHLRKVNQILTIVSLILIVIPIFNILTFELKTGRLVRGVISRDLDISGDNDNGNRPDIYYFIFDRYGGEKTMNLYRFDNSNFYNFLRKKGFYIAEKSTSNYPKTFLSLGSSLNLEYINFLTEETHGGATSDESYVTPLVKNSKVIKFLKGKGYKYIHVGSGWDPTRFNENADVNYVLKGIDFPFADEFTDGFLQTTIAAPILSKLFTDPTSVSKLPKNNDQRSRITYEFNSINNAVAVDGPKFIFMHVLIPHDPYVFDNDCTPISESVTDKRTVTENYLNQLQCGNQKIESMLDVILKNSKQTPVIIFQADEGPFPLIYKIPGNTPWKNASDNSLNEKFPILNAYLLPGIDLKKSGIYPSITPVNSFRMIFNNYFDTKLPFLPDINYIFNDDKAYYIFTDVTSRVSTDYIFTNK